MRSYDNNDGSGAPFGTGVFQHEPIRPSGRPERPIPILAFVLILVLTFALGIAVTLLLTRPDPVTATKPEPKMPTLEALIAASLEPQTVTRAAPLDLLSQPHPIAEVLNGLQPVAHPMTQPARPTVPAAQALAAATALATDQLEQDAERALGLHMRMLREGVLAGVYTVETREKNGNRQLLLRPINVELSRRFMKTLLRAAEERGQITFPKGLSTEDGEVDLWNSVEDAIGSVANYFYRHGWKNGQVVAEPASYKASGKSLITDSPKPVHTFATMKKAGIYPKRKGNGKYTLLQLQAEQGAEYWIGHHNFYVITRYNHSNLYAMAVYQLSQEIQSRKRSR